MNKITLKVLILTITAACFASCSFCQSNNNSEQKSSEINTPSSTFMVPVPPSILIDHNDIAKYMVDNYWNTFDFADSTQLKNRDFVEAHFYNYINSLVILDLETSKKGLKKLLSSIEKKQGVLYPIFMDIFENFYYQANSPYRDEEMYIIVLESIISSVHINDIDKVRSRFHLEMANRNSVGTKANDIEYMLSSGKMRKMHNIKADYTILFFNSLHCVECNNTKEVISNDPLYRKLIKSKKLAVLAICTDDNIEEWETSIYPKLIINGFDKIRSISNDNLYFVPATPCLYLLDKNKNVILKDVDFNVLNNWLTTNLT